MGANFRDAMADLYRPFWASSIIAVLDGFDNSASDIHTYDIHTLYIRVHTVRLGNVKSDFF